MIRATLDCSDFFQTHEVIGSSLLFVHDRTNASIWLIDFAKTVELPESVVIDHNSAWTVGNHEDGYLIGINNMIDIFTELLQENTVVPSAIDEQLSSSLASTNLSSESREESPVSASPHRSSISTPSIVKTNSTQQIIILDSSKLVDGFGEDT